MYICLSFIGLDVCSHIPAGWEAEIAEEFVDPGDGRRYRRLF